MTKLKMARRSGVPGAGPPLRQGSRERKLAQWLGSLSMWGQRKAETEVWNSGTARAALHPVTEGPWLAKRKEQVVT